ncbi:unnamed protein product [Blepharisma stoltei]|uniref:Uncharacterized protein n=1 Tax=Blepharisma stoltei TaxID=1481888 RepID=A0AAU9JBY1_9CILI|nr:unnamed protein product [Blepharisma stoltei]
MKKHNHSSSICNTIALDTIHMKDLKKLLTKYRESSPEKKFENPFACAYNSTPAETNTNINHSSKKSQNKPKFTDCANMGDIKGNIATVNEFNSKQNNEYITKLLRTVRDKLVSLEEWSAALDRRQKEIENREESLKLSSEMASNQHRKNLSGKINIDEIIDKSLAELKNTDNRQNNQNSTHRENADNEIKRFSECLERKTRELMSKEKYLAQWDAELAKKIKFVELKDKENVAKANKLDSLYIELECRLKINDIISQIENDDIKQKYEILKRKEANLSNQINQWEEKNNELIAREFVLKSKEAQYNDLISQTNMYEIDEMQVKLMEKDNELIEKEASIRNQLSLIARKESELNEAKILFENEKNDFLEQSMREKQEIESSQEILQKVLKEIEKRDEIICEKELEISEKYKEIHAEEVALEERKQKYIKSWDDMINKFEYLQDSFVERGDSDKQNESILQYIDKSKYQSDSSNSIDLANEKESSEFISIYNEISFDTDIHNFIINS